MDFVVSKVAMSICALVVIGVLSGATESRDGDLVTEELDAIVSQVCSLIDRAVLSGAEVSLKWSVPDLASGDHVSVTVYRSVVRADSGGQGCARQPQFGVHTWTWVGVALNESVISAMDSSSRAIELVSGEELVLSTEIVLSDNEPILLAFARATA